MLSAWSYHHWLAETGSLPRADAFRRRAWLLASGIGGLLFCLGFATSGRWWEAIVWSLLALFAVLRVWRGIQSSQWTQA